MRLKSLWIDGFKNLNDFKIDFENRGGITVLIGNNASGKSNILEVISAIFAGLYDNELEKLNFKFDLIYNIYDADIRVSKKQKIRYRIKKSNNKSWSVVITPYEHSSVFPSRAIPQNLIHYVPSQVIALYSGEETRLRRYHYQRFAKKYNKSVIDSKIQLESSQKMLYINGRYWDVALLTMMASDICLDNIIGNTKLEEIKLRFNIKNINNFGTNEVVNFANSICGNNNLVTVDLEEFKKLSNYEVRNRLFNLLCVSYLTKDKLKIKSDKIISQGVLIKKIGLIFSKNLTTFSFSEGQKKQILLKLVLEVLADENSLLLFDEPDAHIHISNKKLIPEMLKEYKGKREIVLTTHSPTLAHSFKNKHLAYVDNGTINTDYNNTEKILNELTNGSMGVSEQQIFLQSDKDILIVEGKTDEAYISQALKVLKINNPKYKDLDFNFLWLGGTDADTLEKIINTFEPKENQTIIVFLDADSSGYGCIKEILGIEAGKKDFKGGVKNGIYIHLYPKKEGFTESNFEVEDYFPIQILKSFVDKECTTFQNVKSKFKKIEFAKHCKEDDFDKENFKGFKALFDKILKIKKLSVDKIT